MAKADLTTKSYQTLNSLDMSIRAFVEFAHILPEEDRFSPLLQLLADRIEGDFTAMRNDTIRFWSASEDD